MDLDQNLLQAGRTMHGSSMSRRYEDRPALGSDTSHQQTLPSTGASSVTNLGELHKQAAMLSKLPVVSKLLANPEAVDRLSAQSPQLAQMLAANPFLKDMLQPQAVSQLLQAAQDPQSLQNLLGTPLLASIFCHHLHTASRRGLPCSDTAVILSLLFAAQQQGMRVGLERLGANRDVLPQMKALSENLKQHRSAQAAHDDANAQAQPMPGANATKGPRLPLRPKPQQQKQRPGTVGDSHGPFHLCRTQADGNGLLKEGLLKDSSLASPGQENRFHSTQNPTYNQMQLPWPIPATAVAASQEEQPSSMLQWHSTQSTGAHQQQTSAHNSAGSEAMMAGRSYSAMATPAQLLTGMQESLVGHQRTASDAAEQDLQLPLSYTGAPGPPHLGESPLLHFCASCLHQLGDWLEVVVCFFCHTQHAIGPRFACCSGHLPKHFMSSMQDAVQAHAEPASECRCST